MTLSVRSSGNPESLAPAIRRELSAIDPDEPVTEVTSMDNLVESLSASRRFTLLLIATLSVAALFLAVVGIYGVIAYSIAQRTQELGIRMALGAARGDILQLVLTRGLLLTLAGIAFGAAGALAMTRVITSLLYQTSPHDPIAYIASALVFVAAALLASYFPARRATRIDPADALRSQ
jgi:ABC-type antimicrobial peptide transport system permease subunit